jgi:hypothetical protein
LDRRSLRRRILATPCWVAAVPHGDSVQGLRAASAARRAIVKIGNRLRRGRRWCVCQRCRLLKYRRGLGRISGLLRRCSRGHPGVHHARNKDRLAEVLADRLEQPWIMPGRKGRVGRTERLRGAASVMSTWPVSSKCDSAAILRCAARPQTGLSDPKHGDRPRRARTASQIFRHGADGARDRWNRQRKSVALVRHQLSISLQ